MSDKKLTPRQFANARGVHYRTALDWIKKGLIPGVEQIALPTQKGGGQYLIPARAVTEFIAPKTGPKGPRKNGQRKPADKRRP